MVKGAEERSKKYEAKIDPDTLKRQTEALKPLMTRKASQYFISAAELERSVKVILDRHGIFPLAQANYLFFARELNKHIKNLSGKTVIKECCLTYDKWVTRELDANVLNEIANLLGAKLDCKIKPYDVTLEVTGEEKTLWGFPHSGRMVHFLGLCLDASPMEPENTIRFRTWIKIRANGTYRWVNDDNYGAINPESIFCVFWGIYAYYGLKVTVQMVGGLDKTLDFQLFFDDTNT